MTAARRFLPLVAFAGAIILLHQLSDLAAGLTGVDYSIPAGRIRLVIAVIGRSAGFLTADALLLWAAYGLDRTEWLRLLAVLHFLIGLGLLLGIPLYMSDTGHLARTVGGEELRVYRVIVVRTLLMALGLGLTSLLAGRALLGLRQAPAPVPA